MDTEYLAREELERVVLTKPFPLGEELLALDALLLNQSDVVPQDLFDGTRQAIH